MKTLIKTCLKLFCNLCLIAVIFSSNVLAQGFVGGKKIKQDYWKNNLIEYVAGEVSVFVEPYTTNEEIMTIISKFKGELKREIDKKVNIRLSLFRIR